MITEIVNGITKLTAAKGMVLKFGDSEGTEVWLAPTAKASDWVEGVKTAPLDPSTLDPVALKTELDRYKLAVAEVTAINTSTALKTTLVDAVNRLKVAVAGPILRQPVAKG